MNSLSAHAHLLDTKCRKAELVVRDATTQQQQSRQVLILSPIEMRQVCKQHDIEQQLRGIVLIVGGTRAVVRPVNTWCWEQIERLRPHTKNVSVCLVMNTTMHV